MKNPVTPPGIDPRAVRLVAQHLKTLRIPRPPKKYCCLENQETFDRKLFSKALLHASLSKLPIRIYQN